MAVHGNYAGAARSGDCEMMRSIPITLDQAKQFVGQEHRHHAPPHKHRWSIGAVKNGKLVGVVVVGRPVSGSVEPYLIAEVIRLATDGTKNACSFLYGKAARVAKEMGYKSTQTFTLPEEGGASLRAVGWAFVHATSGDDWHGRKGRPNRRTDQPQGPKWKWQRLLNKESVFSNWRPFGQ
jgi:hypothetical protein